jgi:hypothetical protein
MRIQTSFVLIASATLFSCGKATQPKPVCRAQQAEYAARYFDPEMSGTCTPDDIMDGEVLHMAYYRTTPAGGIPKLAIEPASIADHVGEVEHWNEGHEAMQIEITHSGDGEFSLGSFKDSQPDDNDICTAATLSEAGVTIPEIPADAMAMPPTTAIPGASYKYKWSNVKFITQPLSNAIHFGADLERTSGACTVKYKVSGINPVIHCGNGTKPKEDEHGMVLPGTETMPDPESGDPDPAACKPSGIGEPEGSGLSPDYTYECVPHILMCLPAKKFPSRK